MRKKKKAKNGGESKGGGRDDPGFLSSRFWRGASWFVKFGRADFF
jgi:hypothetical protein